MRYIRLRLYRRDRDQHKEQKGIDGFHVYERVGAGGSLQGLVELNAADLAAPGLTGASGVGVFF